MQAQNSLPGYISLAEWADRNGFPLSKVYYLCRLGKIEYRFYKRKHFVPSDFRLKEEHEKDWLTISQFAEKYSMSTAWARRLVVVGKVEAKRRGGKTLLSASVRLVRKERVSKAGNKFIFFQVENKLEACYA